MTQPPDEPPRPAPGWGALPAPPPPSWGPPPAAWLPPPPKPGIVALRPLGVGDLLDGAIAAVRTNPRTMLGLSAAVLVVAQLLQLLVLGTTFVELERLARPGTSPEELFRALGRLVPAYVGAAVLAWVATTLLTGVLAHAVGQAVIGARPGPGQAWRAVRPVAWRLLGMTLLVGVAVVAPVLLAVPVGLVVLFAADSVGVPVGWSVLVLVLLVLVALAVAVWLWLRWALAPAALVLESNGGARHVGVVEAMRRSAGLVRGASWRTLGLLLLVAVLAAVVSGVVAAPFNVAGGALDPSQSVGGLALQALGSLIGSLLTVPFAAAAVTLVYVDRRMRAEGLAAELARAAGVPLPGVPPPA